MILKMKLMSSSIGNYDQRIGAIRCGGFGIPQL